MPLPFTRAQREQRFWRWFSENSNRLFAFERDQDAVFGALSTELHRVHKNLTFEFGPVTDGRREFIVSAGGIQAAFPSVRSLVASAPALPSWHVIAFRPPKSLDLKLSIGGLTLRADEVWFEAFEEGERIAVALYIRGYTPERQELFGQGAFILLDCALGEYAVEMRLGGIDLGMLPEDPEAQGLMPFREIREVFDPVTH